MIITPTRGDERPMPLTLVHEGFSFQRTKGKAAH
jgi:hypothetical protein